MSTIVDRLSNFQCRSRLELEHFGHGIALSLLTSSSLRSFVDLLCCIYFALGRLSAFHSRVGSQPAQKASAPSTYLSKSLFWNCRTAGYCIHIQSCVIDFCRWHSHLLQCAVTSCNLLLRRWFTSGLQTYAPRLRLLTTDMSPFKDFPFLQHSSHTTLPHMPTPSDLHRV
jgi:hypothetical protein